MQAGKGWRIWIITGQQPNASSYRAGLSALLSFLLPPLTPGPAAGASIVLGINFHAFYQLVCKNSRYSPFPVLSKDSKYRLLLLYFIQINIYRVCRFGSWTYDGNKLDIVERRYGGYLDLTTYQNACPSVVQSHESRRNIKYYDCCPEPYVDINMKLLLASR